MIDSDLSNELLNGIFSHIQFNPEVYAGWFIASIAATLTIFSLIEISDRYKLWSVMLFILSMVAAFFGLFLVFSVKEAQNNWLPLSSLLSFVFNFINVVVLVLVYTRFGFRFPTNPSIDSSTSVPDVPYSYREWEKDRVH